MKTIVKILLAIILALPVLGLIVYCAISGFSVAWGILTIIGPWIFGLLMVVFMVGLLVKVFLPKGKKR